MKNMFRVLFWALWPLIWLYAPLRTRARVLVVSGQEFLAVKPYFGSGAWQLPGGGIKFGEQPIIAAARELYEETGMTVDQQKLTQLLPVATYKEHGLLLRYAIFIITLPQKPDIANQKHEIAASAWLPVQGSYIPAHIKSALTAFNIG